MINIKFVKTGFDLVADFTVNLKDFFIGTHSVCGIFKANVKPVIDCPANNPSNCSTVVGVVHIDIVWVSEKDADTEDKFAAEDFPPSAMGDWTCPSSCTGSRVCCWNDFVSHFKLENVDGMTATYAAKSIYFLPSCEPHEPTGGTGGNNYGVLAQFPVLVK